MKAHIFRGIALMAVAILSLPVSGQVTYRYVGNAFDTFHPDGSSYTPNDFVTLTLTLDAALPGNLVLENVSSYAGFHLSLSDGRQELTHVPGVPGVARVSTDADGNIIGPWRVFSYGAAEQGLIETNRNWGGDLTVDVAAVYPSESDPDSRYDFARVENNPGAWSTVDASGTPLSVSSGELSFSFVQQSEAAVRRVVLSNLPSDGVQIGVTTQTGGPWLSFRAGPDDPAPIEELVITLTVTADPMGLPPGTYSGEIRISNTASGESVTVPVTMAISARQQLLRLSQTGATFRAASGPVAARSFQVFNDGSEQLAWTATATTLAGGDWLTAAPSSGSSDAFSSPSIEMRVDPSGLSEGVYYGLVEVSAPEAASSPQFVTVVLDRRALGDPSDLVVEPAGLIFAASENNPGPDSQSLTITNPSNNPISFTSSRSTEDGNDWFLQSPTQGTVFPSQPLAVSVQVNPSGLTPGIYRGTLRFSFDNGTETAVDLVLIVASNTAINLKQVAKNQNGCTRTELAPVFRLLGGNTNVRGGWPVLMEVEVADDCGARMEQGTVVVEFANISSPEMALRHTQAGVWAGTWTPPNPEAVTTAAVRVEAADSAGIRGEFSSQLRVVPNADPPPRVNRGGVVHGASFVRDPLAPNTIVSFFGSGLSEEPKEGGQAAPIVPLPSELAGTEITVAGLPVPLLFSREDQVNGLLPFELTERLHEILPVLVRRGRTVSSSELMLISGARPGVFTQNRSGNGPGAVADLGGVTVNAANPVSVGDVVQIYATGLGDVAPEVATGEAAPDAPLSYVTQEVEVTIAGAPADVYFAGLAPGFVGLYQINAGVPPGVPVGEAELVVSVAGQPSATVTLSVQ